MKTIKRLFFLSLLLVASTGWCVGSSTLDLGNAALVRSCFLASRTSSITVNSVTFTPLTGLTEVYDMTYNFDGSATFTAPVSGVYSISGSGYSQPTVSAGTAVMGIYLNGNATIDGGNSGRASSYQDTLTGALVSFTLERWLNAGDLVSLWVYQNTGAAGAIINVRFSIHRVYPN